MVSSLERGRPSQRSNSSRSSQPRSPALCTEWLDITNSSLYQDTEASTAPESPPRIKTGIAPALPDRRGAPLPRIGLEPAGHALLRAWEYALSRQSPCS